MSSANTSESGPHGCRSMEEMAEKAVMAPFQIASSQLGAGNHFMTGLTRYLSEFLTPYMLSTQYFSRVEAQRLLTTLPLESLMAYMELAEFSFDIYMKNLMSSMRALNDYGRKEFPNALTAALNTCLMGEGEDLNAFFARQEQLVARVTREYPEAILEIAPEYGFHFERGHNPLLAETDRFLLYEIVPTDPSVAVDLSAKPILILPPYVLGANILSFLPGENRSYAHCFANQGIPTYIRILKNIGETPALQTMTAEDDALDTRLFCEKIKQRHGKPVTLNGYCQGGFMAVCNLLSGELDGLVDALLTCVAPMDGTRSVGLSGFLGDLPSRFNDLSYGTKTLASGNQVADGKLMGWVYKLKSIETEAPLVAFYRDMMMLAPRNGKTPKISKTAAALNYWLNFERADLPMAITRMSFASYNHPVDAEGNLPVTLFGRKLNFKRIAEKNIPWLICYGEKDDLVEKSTALAPTDFVDAEVSPFPKGHVAMATSWSDPRSEYALHTRFGENRRYRGPVRFQLDLNRAMSPDTPA